MMLMTAPVLNLRTNTYPLSLNHPHQFSRSFLGQAHS